MIQLVQGKVIDVFIFMGQSNMAGRGCVSEKWTEVAPKIYEGAGYEYRAISCSGDLHKIEEPFGVYENNLVGINDRNKKTGSMVTSFVNAYYEKIGIPIIGISASEGGTSILKWQVGERLLDDAIERFKNGIKFLEEEDLLIRHKYMVWCQGETDGDRGMSTSTYKERFESMLSEMLKVGIEHCFLVSIGHYNGHKEIDYSNIIEAQRQLATINDKVTMVSNKFLEMKARGLMKDDFHYYQQAYNEVGTEAGKNAARFVETICLTKNDDL